MLLKVGSKGEDVCELQRRLGLSADGIFGTNTEKSVKRWQEQHSLTPDGVVGDETWASLTSNPERPIAQKPVNISRLHGLLPETVYGLLEGVMDKYGIDCGLDLSHFLAQCHHESAAFRKTTENLNYSSAGLLRTFPTHYRGADGERLAQAHSRSPQKIANHVYANRNGNGDDKSGDGWAYRGRGYIGLTGKNNYILFEKDSGLDGIVSNPDLVATTYPLDSSGWFWKVNGISSIARTGSTDKVVEAVTRKVNGGTNGLADRISLFHHYFEMLGR